MNNIIIVIIILIFFIIGCSFSTISSLGIYFVTETKSSVSQSTPSKLPDGSPCPSGNDNICQSNDCDCSFPHSSGDTCCCGGTCNNSFISF